MCWYVRGNNGSEVFFCENIVDTVDMALVMKKIIIKMCQLSSSLHNMVDFNVMFCMGLLRADFLLACVCVCVRVQQRWGCQQLRPLRKQRVRKPKRRTEVVRPDQHMTAGQDHSPH